MTTDPYACSWLLMAAFALAGVAHVMWLASPWSRLALFSRPLDGGRTLRGRRLFGDNKQIRGFVVMVPAAALAFVVVAQILGRGDPGSAGLWALTPTGYALAGAVAGFGFMAGELPNSFIKRQLDIAPGAAASNRVGAVLQLAADRIDSELGTLTALGLVVPTPWQTWAMVLLLGWTLHWSFSAALFRLRVKPRHA
jgi:CDP-archaeol synthase